MNDDPTAVHHEGYDLNGDIPTKRNEPSEHIGHETSNDRRVPCMSVDVSSRILYLFILEKVGSLVPDLCAPKNREIPESHQSACNQSHDPFL